MVTDILSTPVRVNERARCVYFFDGYVSVDVVSGTEAQQKATLALIAQAQEMAKVLRDFLENYELGADVDARLARVLRAAGVMSDADDTKRGP